MIGASVGPFGPDANDVFKDRNLFRTQKLRAVRERTRERKNWRFYDGTDYGQWDEQAVRLLQQEGRPPHTFNFIETKVDTIVGSVLNDEYQTSYETELGEKNDVAIMLNELYMEDRDLCNFEFEFLQFVRAGFVYRGYLEFYVDRAKDPRGRLAWRYVSPDRIQVDADWRSNNLNDCKWLFQSAWMSPEEIAWKYKSKASEIKQAVEDWERVRHENLQQSELEKIFDRSDEFYDKLNGLHLVIEKYELKRTEKMALWDPVLGEFLPDQDGEDAKLVQKMGVLQGKRYELLPKTVVECHVHSFCPSISLNLSLQKGPTELQVGGYPFFSFSSNMINGHPNTLVDQLRDAQEAYNKRVSTATHILMTSANNALLIESDAVEDQTELDRIGKQRGRPGAYFVVEPGTISQRKIAHLEKAPPPTDFAQAADQMLNVAQQLTPAVPAVQAQLDQTGESGVLFQSKLAQAQIAMQIPQKFLKAFWHQIGDAYFRGVKQHYTYPMVFQSSRQNVPFYLNVPGGIMVEEMSRLKVIITQSPNSESFRRQLLQQYVSLAQYLPDPATKQALSRLVIQSLPGVPDEELQKLSEVAKLSEDYQKLVLVFQTNQVAAQMSAMQNPQPPPSAPVDPIRVSLALKGPDMHDPLVLDMLKTSGALGPDAGASAGGGPMPIGGSGGAPPQPQMPGINAPSQPNPKGVPFQNAQSGPQGFLAGVQGQPGMMGG